ncbi:hypothetical protein NQ314_007706 [Rhamnusium bicolor]|uniref:Uncharacterized protein n=1 Tax=Rhamnusium bicolor TaxID=1586634 RepID=A0AAV8YKU5_9CUCU|nr:hypothetical protein NQ314_007706 [Rhamnusium bicolor]
MEEKYMSHIIEKELSRKEKGQDKNRDDRTIVLVFDLQTVLPCPIGDASSFYYGSKLNLFNFTLYDLKNHQGTCFMWHEGEACRGANEIGTWLFRYLQTLGQQTQEDLNLIFYYWVFSKRE